jgi:hypothetical protein
MISHGFAAKAEGQVLGEVCFEFLHLCPDELAKKSADQIQFAIQWANQRASKLKEEVEYAKWKASRQ